MYPQQAGAGGNWPVIDEVLDPEVVQQQNDLSCGSACGEMLLKKRGINNISQATIANQAGVPVTCRNLANVLNTIDFPEGIQQWVGGPLAIPGATDSQLFETLNNTGSWAALLWEVGAGIGHMVLVDGLDEAGYVLIRDPWDGTSYKMRKDDFLKYWTTQAVFRS